MKMLIYGVAFLSSSVLTYVIYVYITLYEFRGWYSGFIRLVMELSNSSEILVLVINSFVISFLFVLINMLLFASFWLLLNLAFIKRKQYRNKIK
jgi:hypothetical protein